MKSQILKRIGPGMLIAATGVGAGDLAMAAFSGVHIGLSILWVILLGAFFKYLLNEALARWQIAENRTFLDGTFSQLPAFWRYFFLIYFIVWSFPVSAALMSAFGAASHALFPLFDATTDKIVYGIFGSLLAWWLIRKGGFSFFEKGMAFSILIMFITVLVTAIALQPNMGAVLNGLFIPKLPASGQELIWSIGLIGGVGGTVTILSYSYWIREEAHAHLPIKARRLDLALGYALTALFGMALVVIGSVISVEGSGVKLIIIMGNTLGSTLGPLYKWLFLVGAWSAIFSSVLGVWQGVPYLFADMWHKLYRPNTPVSTEDKAYRRFQLSLVTVPIIGLAIGFAHIQKIYAVLGALFIPMLTATLLYLGQKKEGIHFKNGVVVQLLLWVILLFFAYAGWLTVQKVL